MTKVDENLDRRKNEAGLNRLMGFHPIFVDFNGVIFFSLFIHVMYMY